MLNWKVFGRKRLWPNLKYYLDNCLERLRKTTINLSQDSLSLGRELNPEPPEYEAGVLAIRLRRSEKFGAKLNNCDVKTK
jgi:hypothetical protein